MINRILIELYDDYENNNLNSLIEFTNRTLPQNGTDKLFIGCCIIMFSKVSSSFKPRYHVSRELLYSIVLAAKEKVGPSNLLSYYVKRVNTQKGIDKYLKNVIHDPNIDKYADLIIEYLDQFKPNFVEELKLDTKKIEKYIASLQKLEENNEK